MNTQDTGALKTSRRTLVKGAAWSVPVVAMGAPAMAQDAACSPNSCPPPPSINWGGACGSVGNGLGCSGQKKALQVPITMVNTTDSDMIFVVEGAWSANGGGTPYPTSPPAAGSAGSGYGFFGFGENGSHCVSGVATSDCPGISPIASNTSKVLVPAGTSTTMWYAFFGLGSSSDFVGKVWYSWYEATTCTKVVDTQAQQTPSAIPDANCDGFANPA
ncbi:hypothetical protein [Ornithinimicrobium avium]|uniref:hypothetical protein n=1 Tax=Ornithinimicrobium avium TaxID=2283195 RepID=UPI0013B3FA15|nr:hypothetical protein [Ornithinimicrobium avium]